MRPLDFIAVGSRGHHVNPRIQPKRTFGLLGKLTTPTPAEDVAEELRRTSSDFGLKMYNLKTNMM